MHVSLSDFRVQSYRSLDGLQLPKLTRVNVVTGGNGVGKTALLEALWLFTGRYNSPLLWNLNVQRSGNSHVDPVAPLSPGRRIVLCGTENGTEFEYAVEYVAHAQPENINVPGEVPAPQADSPVTVPVVGKLRAEVNGKELPHQTFNQTPKGLVAASVENIPRANCIIEGTRWQLESSGEDMKRYSELVQRGEKSDLRDSLRLIHPRLEDVEMLSNERGSYLSGLATSGQRYPIQAFGGGMVRLFRLYLAVFTSQNSVVLIDEIENGLHYTVLADMWRKVRSWSDRWNVQIFATTHSRECIQAAIEAFEDTKDDLTIHNLYRRDGVVEAATFAGEPLVAAQELDIELR